MDVTIDPAWYAGYLRSPHWLELAAECKRRAHYKCEAIVDGRRCGSRFRLHAHHRTYERIGKELPEDLECRCRKCHRAGHGQAPDPTPGERARLSFERLQQRFARFMTYCTGSDVDLKRKAAFERRLRRLR